MMRVAFRRELEKKQTVLVLVWAGFLISTGLCLVIPQFFIVHSDSLGNLHLGTVFRQILWTIVIIEMGLLFWWKKRFLTKQEILRKSREAVWVPILVRGHQSSTEEFAARAMSCYVIGKIVAFAIAGSLAVDGLYLAYVGQYFKDQLVMSLICLVFLIYFYPSQPFFADLLREFP